MIDLHSHILPGIDDGARDKREADFMIESLIKNKIDTVVCTPHFNPSREPLKEFIVKRSKAYKDMESCELKLILASETYFNEVLFYYEDITPLCMKDTRYILIEFPVDIKFNTHLFTSLNKFIVKYDVIPIIAHVERYKYLKKKRLLYKLKDMGCLLQVNTSSLLNKDKKLLKLLKEKLIDVLGSDCHNMSSRPPVFSDALQIIKKGIGEDYIEGLDRNSRDIINNIDIRNRDIFRI